MNKGGNKMGFHEEQFIGGLHIVAMPHALTFRGKQLLVLKTSQMLNDGVTVNQIKGTILERKVLAIRNNQGKVTLSLSLSELTGLEELRMEKRGGASS